VVATAKNDVPVYFVCYACAITVTVLVMVL
jgi:hypothetical protein